MSQITQHILMIQPVSFRFNEQTAVNNYYQKVLGDLSPQATQEKALSEFNAFPHLEQHIGLLKVLDPSPVFPASSQSISLLIASSSCNAL